MWLWFVFLVSYINLHLVIPDPRFMCLAPLNSNLSRDWIWASSWEVWDVVGVVVFFMPVAAAALAVLFEEDLIVMSCSLIYCASVVWLRISSSLDA